MTEGTWLNVALVGAGGALFGGGWGAVRGHERSKCGRVLLAATGVALGGALVARWRAAGHAPLSSQYESLVFVAFATAWSTFAWRGSPAWANALAGLGVALLLGLAALVRGPAEPLVPALQSNWLLIHVAITMTAYAVFLLAAGAGGWLLLRGRLPGPPPKELDGFAYRAVVGGVFLLAVGIATGAVWANEAWGTWWSWDPKETWALITWIGYTLALHLRRTRAWRGDRFAWLTVAGIALVGFTYFGVNYLLTGLHSYASGGS